MASRKVAQTLEQREAQGDTALTHDPVTLRVEKRLDSKHDVVPPTCAVGKAPRSHHIDTTAVLHRGKEKLLAGHETEHLQLSKGFSLRTRRTPTLAENSHKPDLVKMKDLCPQEAQIPHTNSLCPTFVSDCQCF